MPSERDISRTLAARENGQCEVKTPVGFIDVFTPTVVYEVKEAGGWKGALGQVFAYGRSYPDRKLCLYLYGTASSTQKQVIKEHCNAQNVAVVWHREQGPTKAASPAAIFPIADGLKLQIAARDLTYDLRAASLVRLVTPTAPIARAQLDAYLDLALATFDPLLDNDLTLTFNYAFGGDRVTIKRTRPGDRGNPVCYRLNLTIRTACATHISTSLPGIKKQLPSGAYLHTRREYVYARDIPELARLYDFILHPEFLWMNANGHPATSIKTAYQISRVCGGSRARCVLEVGNGARSARGHQNGNCRNVPQRVAE